MTDRSHPSRSESAVRDLLRRRGIRLHDSVIAELATAAERDRYCQALEEIASDLGHPGDPAWRRAMEALGRDADAAEQAWHD